MLLKCIGVISERLYIIHVIKPECDSELNNFIAIFSFLFYRIGIAKIIYCVDIRRCFEDAACLKEHIDHRECRCRAISGCWNTILLCIFSAIAFVELEALAAFEHSIVTVVG